MKKQKKYFLFLFMLLLLFIVQFTFAQNQISASVISSGGNKSVSTGFILRSTIGEPVIGKTMSAGNQHYSGFWYVYKQSIVTGIEKNDETIPTVFELKQNYPNPFNPSTIIKFAVPERSMVVLKVYDLLGAEVVTLVNEQLDAGRYIKQFNANNYSSGIYLYRMQAGTFVSTKKMILIK